MAFRSWWGLGGTEHSQDTWKREWESPEKEIPLKQCCCAPPGCSIHALSPGSAVCAFHWDQWICEVQSNRATWSAAFSRNLGAEFEIFGGVYSIKRCKSLWSAMGPTCHTALCAAEIPGGRSGPSVLKSYLWERTKGSQCQISPFFPPTSLGHSSCSHDFKSDFFRCLFQSSFPSHHHTSQPSALSLLQIPASAWMKHASDFLQDSSQSPVFLTWFCYAISRVVRIYGYFHFFSWLEYKNIS